jgi:hypothetical protein
MTNATTKVPHAHVLRIAVEADVAIETVRKALRGRLIRGRAGERLAEVLARRGIVLTSSESRRG